MAASYLEEKGYKILARQFKCRVGEIDLIAISSSRKLVAVEVKYRKNNSHGEPECFVDARKQLRVRKAFLYYMVTHKINPECSCQIDVIGICGSKIRHIENAF